MQLKFKLCSRLNSQANDYFSFNKPFVLSLRKKNPMLYLKSTQSISAARDYRG